MLLRQARPITFMHNKSMSIQIPLFPHPPTSCLDEKKSLDNDAPIESNACKDVTKDKKTFDLQPVLPYSSGEGWPYAPEGWPNPGDVWGWKVQRRTYKSGYYQDRYLSLPRSLQQSYSCKTLHSKLDVMRYIESNFPDMKIEEFFALFSWQVPSTEQTPTKVKSPKTGEEISTKRKIKPKTQICCQPTRKSSRLVRARPSSARDQDANFIDLSECNSDSEEGQTVEENNPNVDDNADISDDMLDDMPNKSLSLAIQEIDDEIRQLESKQNEVSIALEAMHKKKAELTSIV